MKKYFFLMMLTIAIPSWSGDELGNDRCTPSPKIQKMLEDLKNIKETITSLEEQLDEEYHKEDIEGDEKSYEKKRKNYFFQEKIFSLHVVVFDLINLIAERCGVLSKSYTFCHGIFSILSLIYSDFGLYVKERFGPENYNVIEMAQSYIKKRLTNFLSLDPMERQLFMNFVHYFCDLMTIYYTIINSEDNSNAYYTGIMAFSILPMKLSYSLYNQYQSGQGFKDYYRGLYKNFFSGEEDKKSK